jgi:hypothetical protein
MRSPYLRQRRSLERSGLHRHCSDQGRHHETKGREHISACDLRKGDLDVAPVGNVFRDHAAGAMTRDGMQDHVAHEHASGELLVADLLDPLEGQHEIIAPASVEDGKGAVAAFLVGSGAAVILLGDEQCRQGVRHAHHVRLRQRHPVRPGGRAIGLHCRDHALLEPHFQIGLLALFDQLRRKFGRHQAAILDAARHPGAALAAHQHIHQVNAAAGGRGRVAIGFDAHRPGALADADAGHRYHVARFQLLGVRPAGRQPVSRCGQQNDAGKLPRIATALGVGCAANAGANG